MDYASLASGSKGNCHAIHHHGTVLLIDAGLSLRQVERRLNLIGWDLGWVQGIAITHEHNDHISALPVLLLKYGLGIFADGTNQKSHRE